MTSLRAVAIGALIIWMLVDGAVVFRRATGRAENRDRHSLKAIAFGNLAGWLISIWIAFTPCGTFHPAPPWQVTGLVLMAAGIALRFTAIAQLGRFHTPNVAVLADHVVVERGLYRHIRHPSYLGAMIAFCGFGLGLGNWLSWIVVVVLNTTAYLYRIREEEAALVAALGERYASYQRRTARLIPHVF